MKYIFLILFFTFQINVFSQSIFVDEDFSDWESIDILYADSLGDGSWSVDFQDFKAADDSLFLFLMLEVTHEINLQNDNDIILYIDTDNNSATGLAVEGIGAELEYRLGSRYGSVRLPGFNDNIHHQDIGLVSSPTVTSSVFELLIRKDAAFSGSALFPQEQIKFVIKDLASGDMIPDETGGLDYSLASGAGGEIKEFSIEKEDPEYLRILSWNTLYDGLFEASRLPHFENILSATGFDIIGFQEIYDHNGYETAQVISDIIPPATGTEYYYSNIEPDIICVSKYEILQSFAIDGNGAFLIDLGEDYDNRQMLFISAHPPCCDNDVQRQEEIDAIMAFIRNAKEPGGMLELEENSPIVICGDMNLVGLNEQLNTLLTGDIKYEGMFGPDFDPDWDGSPLEDSKPSATSYPSSFTWYDEGSAYSPGRLDLMIYTGSVMTLENTYSLFTPALSNDELTLYNLLSEDSPSASDHQPVIADFSFESPNNIDETSEIPTEFELKNNYPNPFNPSTIIEYDVKENVKVVLKIYDILGREVKTLVNKEQAPGSYQVNFEAAGLSSGVYIYQIRMGDFSAAEKMVLSR